MEHFAAVFHGVCSWLERKPRPTQTGPGLHPFMSTLKRYIRVFEEGYLAGRLGSLSEESAEQTAFLLQRTENTFKQTSQRCATAGLFLNGSLSWESW